MGELLNDGKSVRGTGVGVLARGQRTLPTPCAVTPPRQRLLQCTLLATDGLLTAGALVFLLRHPTPDGQATAVCALAVLLGAWLGWCGLTQTGSES